nr:adenylate/guanylate cyclase domain-containing protein [Sinorhizobium medicae]
MHYGEVVVGNTGHARRLEYTIIGDTVNCGRLERLTRGAASHVMVSGDLIAAIRSQGIEPTSLRQPCSSRLPELLSFRARCEGSPLPSQRQLGRRLITAS